MILCTVPHAGKCSREDQKRNCDRVAERIALLCVSYFDNSTYHLVVNKNIERKSQCLQCDLNRDPSLHTLFREQITLLLKSHGIKLLIDFHSFPVHSYGKCIERFQVAKQNRSESYPLMGTKQATTNVAKKTDDFMQDEIGGTCQIVFLYEDSKMMPFLLRLAQMGEECFGPKSIAILEGKGNSIIEEAARNGIPALLMETNEQIHHSDPCLKRFLTGLARYVDAM
jgi:hypothetical protein